jgi:hypothetical protein
MALGVTGVLNFSFPFATATRVGSPPRVAVCWIALGAVASPTYWFMMQVRMIIGLFTASPVNTWLIRSGVKEKM